MLFLRKTDETIWKPPSFYDDPLSTNPPISEQFFHDPPLSKFQKQEPPPNFRGEETMKTNHKKQSKKFKNHE